MTIAPVSYITLIYHSENASVTEKYIRLFFFPTTHSDVLSQKKGRFIATVFSSCSVSVSVALNSSVCRLAGKIPRITSRSLVKSVQPCSNSLSASSIIWHTHRDVINNSPVQFLDTIVQTWPIFHQWKVRITSDLFYKYLSLFSNVLL